MGLGCVPYLPKVSIMFSWNNIPTQCSISFPTSKNVVICEHGSYFSFFSFLFGSSLLMFGLSFEVSVN